MEKKLSVYKIKNEGDISLELLYEKQLKYKIDNIKYDQNLDEIYTGELCKITELLGFMKQMNSNI